MIVVVVVDSVNQKSSRVEFRRKHTNAHALTRKILSKFDMEDSKFVYNFGFCQHSFALFVDLLKLLLLLLISPV